MDGGRNNKRGRNKKKVKARGKNKKENKNSLEADKTDSASAPKEDLDALVAAIEATGVSAVKEAPPPAPKTKNKRKRKRNRKRKKNNNVDGVEGTTKPAAAAKPTYSEFKKEKVREEITALKSIYDNFVRLPDADLPWQTSCPSFRIAQV